MRIIFAGTPEFAAKHLSSLIDSSHTIIAVYTQPDRRAGRGKKLLASPVKQLAEQQGISIEQPVSLKDAQTQDQLASYDADVMIVVAYGLLLPQAVLDIPKHGCLNVHASLLPRWRGAAPIQRAIEAGDTSTGVTIMQMEAGLDTGPMLLTQECAIEPQETSSSLEDKLAELGPPALLETLSLMKTGSLQASNQDNTKACYASKLTKAEAEIYWQQPAITIEQKIRAFNPFPVAFFKQKQDAIRVWEASLLNEATSALPGTIVNITDAGIDVATGDGLVRLQALQMPGKKSQPVATIVNGYRDRFVIGQPIATQAD